MPATCSHCNASIPETDLPRMQKAHVLCPTCEQPLELPAMTMPLAAVSDSDAPPTVSASRVSGGSLSESKRYALVILSGKEPGAIIPIEKARITLGRSGCDIVLDDGELSRQHVLISINGSSARLEDLGSTNGTFVSGDRIERAELEDRSEFRIGSHELLFVITDADSAPP